MIAPIAPTTMSRNFSVTRMSRARKIRRSRTKTAKVSATACATMPGYSASAAPEKAPRKIPSKTAKTGPVTGDHAV